MPKPLDVHFNAAVVTFARRLWPQGFDVAADAPNTLEALRLEYATRKRITVWDGASDHTIFADPEVNYAFRAWHDWCHLAGGHAFDLPGEIACAHMQIEHIKALYGDDATTRGWAAIVLAEVVEQAAHTIKSGAFPIDQAGFTTRAVQRAGHYLAA